MRTKNVKNELYTCKRLGKWVILFLVMDSTALIEPDSGIYLIFFWFTLSMFG